MKIYQYENLIFEVSYDDDNTQIYTVTHKRNKFFATKFARYSATSYQITNEMIPMPVQLLECDRNILPTFRPIDKWTEEFIDFICSTISHIGIFDHLAYCSYTTVWNDAFNVITTCVLDLLNGQISDIECSNAHLDDKGSPLRFFQREYITYYGKDLNSRHVFEIIDKPDGSKFAKGFNTKEFFS